MSISIVARIYTYKISYVIAIKSLDELPNLLWVLCQGLFAHHLTELAWICDFHILSVLFASGNAFTMFKFKIEISLNRK